jgi:hypothetical protein
MKFIAEHTNIPVPKLYCCFEDDEAVYLVREYIEGVGMNELEAKKRKVVEKELEIHLGTMKKLKSKFWGGPSGIVCTKISRSYHHIASWSRLAAKSGR